MRITLAILLFTTLSACGFSSGGFGSGRVSGEIATACMKSGRQAANGAVCSCVQQAANVTLRGGDMSRAASLFGNPEKAEDARRDGGSFWDRYTNFARTAESMCHA